MADSNCRHRRETSVGDDSVGPRGPGAMAAFDPGPVPRKRGAGRHRGILADHTGLEGGQEDACPPRPR